MAIIDGGLLAPHLGRLRHLGHCWRQRGRDRQELARMTEREILDMGVTRLDVLREVQKPFWRA